jgi:hypothetical protein
MISLGTKRLLVLLVVLCLPGSGQALVGDTFEAFGLDGSIRNTLYASANHDRANPADGWSESLLRLVVGGQPKDCLSYEIHGVQSLALSSGTGESLGLFGFWGTAGRYKAFDLAWGWADNQDVHARAWLDRANVKLVLPFADVTAGRQAISFGKAYFWNPLDVYLAFSAHQFDRDYKAGVDAIKIDIPLGDFSGINLVGVMGRSLTGGVYENDRRLDASWLGSSVMGRVFGNVLEWDVAMQIAKVYGGYSFGGALSGELGALAVRAEGAFFLVDEPQVLTVAGHSIPGENEQTDHFTGVIGLGHRFESTLNIEVEFLYNGAADSDLNLAAIRVSNGSTLNMSKTILGLTASYEIIPILSGQAVWMLSFSDGSSLVQLGLTLSVADEADMFFGTLIGLGARPSGSTLQPILKSEFGTYPNSFYMQYKYYF